MPFFEKIINKDTNLVNIKRFVRKNNFVPDEPNKSPDNS